MLQLFFTIFSWVSVVYVTFLCVQLVCILLSDCDLILKFYEHWGKRPEAALRGKVVWITGASSGIGEALAYQLAKAGARVVLSARRENELRRVASKCRDMSPMDTRDAHMVLVMDMLEVEHHVAKTAQVLEQFGKIDVLINNAGRSQRAIAMETELEVDKAIIELNTISVVSLTRAVLTHMIKQGSGQITVISSVAGKLGAPGSASYSTSKHALHGFFDTLRMEVADSGVSVHMVCPGPVETPYKRQQFGATMHKGPVVGGSHEVQKDPTRVSAERCAYLITVAIANKLDEVWISKNPILLFVYLLQYTPNLGQWLGKKVGNRRAKAVKAGKAIIDDVYFKKTE